MRRTYGSGRLYIKSGAYYGRWRAPDGRYLNRRLGSLTSMAAIVRLISAVARSVGSASSPLARRAWRSAPPLWVPSRLAAALLVGLVGNAAAGDWWLDPAVGLLIAAVAVKEGLEAWRGEGCCVSSPLGAAGFAGSACDDDCCAPAAS